LLTKEGTKYLPTLSVSNRSNRESEGKENQ
jgi:hypothetical protein